LNQQNTVTLVPTLNQPRVEAILNGVITGGTGACVPGAVYWDLGIRGDSSSTVFSNPGGYKLNPANSIITAGYVGNGNIQPAAAGLISQYCNGSRVPPEIRTT